MATLNDWRPSQFESLVLPAILLTTNTATSKSAHPARIVLALLHRPSLLVLRLVSKSLKIWVETQRPPLLSALQITFPIPDGLTPKSTSSLYGLATDCQHLTVSFPEIQSQTHYRKAALPPFPRLHQLTIRPSIDENHTFQSLLALRLAAPLLQITHLTLNPLSIQGILALRSGPFSGFCSNASTRIWRNIRSLSLSVLPWWMNAYSQSSTDDSEETPKALSHADKTAFKILHDFFSSFSSNHLDHIRFEWLGLDEGPNPFLLDIWAADHGAVGWFSAPGIQWRMVRSVRLKGVEIEDEGVREMKQRLNGLKKLEVETRWGKEQVEGGLVGADSGDWVVDVMGEGLGDGDDARAIEGRELNLGEQYGIKASPGESFETDWEGVSVDMKLGL